MLKYIKIFLISIQILLQQCNKTFKNSFKKLIFITTFKNTFPIEPKFCQMFDILQIYIYIYVTSDSKSITMILRVCLVIFFKIFIL